MIPNALTASRGIVLRKIAGRYDACRQLVSSTGHRISHPSLLATVGVFVLLILPVVALLALAFAATFHADSTILLATSPAFFRSMTPNVVQAENLRGLLDKRGAVLDSARAILHTAETEKRGLSTDEDTRYKKLMGEAQTLSRSIELSRGELEEQRGQATSHSDESRDAQRRVGPVFVDHRGNKIHTLRNHQRLADSRKYNLPDGIKAEDLDIGRLVRAMATGNWKGAEAEQRAGSVGTDISGGFAVAEPLAARIIDLSRNQARVIRAGAITVPMESSSLAIATLDEDMTAEWKAENAAITDDFPSFGRVNMYTRTLVGLAKMSVELAEDAPNLGQLVESSLAEVIALKLDLGLLRGPGTANELQGVRGTTGIQTVDMGTNGHALNGYDDFSQAYQDIQQVNGPDEGIAVIMSTRDAGYLDRKKDGNGLPLTPPASWRKMVSYSTNQIPTTLTKGSAVGTASEAYVADWQQLLVGMRTQLTLEVTRVGGAASAGAFGNLQVWIRAYLRAASAVVKPDHFVLVDGIIP